MIYILKEKNLYSINDCDIAIEYDVISLINLIMII